MIPNDFILDINALSSEMSLHVKGLEYDMQLARESSCGAMLYALDLSLLACSFRSLPILPKTPANDKNHLRKLRPEIELAQITKRDTVDLSRMDCEVLDLFFFRTRIFNDFSQAKYEAHQAMTNILFLYSFYGDGNLHCLDHQWEEDNNYSRSSLSVIFDANKTQQMNQKKNFLKVEEVTKQFFFARVDISLKLERCKKARKGAALEKKESEVLIMSIDSDSPLCYPEMYEESNTFNATAFDKLQKVFEGRSNGTFKLFGSHSYSQGLIPYPEAEASNRTRRSRTNTNDEPAKGVFIY